MRLCFLAGNKTTMTNRGDTFTDERFQIMLAATVALSLSFMQPAYAETPNIETPTAPSLAGDNKLVMCNEESKKLSRN